uniref:Small ribosomal subunit protein uS3m n=1 Tax=Agaricus bisporus var. bisporus (strain H97 / ATCC MYA-4626 / FGSC 10389) TaxID=936046 RepID=S4SPI6_AGABB|nr:ribosomal protein 3 [Agaricus bitorquis]AFP72255.1 ribosomal protein 3 [Agaricus bisporus var. bisporus H97]WFG54058.1 ribosomal protein 3 [Agaricus bitorquis]
MTILKNIKQGLVPFLNNPSSSSNDVKENDLNLVKRDSKFQPQANTNLAKINFFNANKLNNLVFLSKKGSQKNNPNIISYDFPVTKTALRISQADINKNTVKDMNKFITIDFSKFLSGFFKTTYCLISQPVIISTPDKIKLQLFYFLCIPKIFVVKNLRKVLYGLAFGNKKIKLNNLINRKKRRPSLMKKKVKFILKKLAKSNITKVYPNKFKNLCTILSKYFNRPIELELIRLHQPFYDSNILVNFLALNINKRNIRPSIHKFYKRSFIKSNQTTSLPYSGNLFGSNLENIYNPLIKDTAAQLSGLTIRIGGRLMRQPIIPKKTVTKFEKGFTAKGKINYLDIASLTHKNRKGAFTITVKSGQTIRAT